MTLRMPLKTILRAGYVRRWHIVNASRTQSVAEHTFNVIVISLTLARDIFGEEWAKVNEGSIMRAALEHDLAEVVLGDMPPPTKEILGEIGVDYKVVEDMVCGNTEFSEDILNIVKIADMVDAVSFLAVEGRGPRAQDIINELRIKLHNVVLNLEYKVDAKWIMAQQIINQLYMGI